MKNKKKTIIIASVIALITLIGLGVILSLDLEKIIKWISNLPHGLKELLMISLITIQIFIAFIPGEPLELAAGYMFCSVWGTAVCMVGSFIGTIIVYYLVKIFGNKIITMMFKEEKVEEVKKTFEKKKGLYWVFVLFLIPGTPKDVMTYLVSLTNVRLYKWLAITTIGRIPSIVTSTFITGSIKNQQYILVGIIGIITVIIVTAGFFYYKKLNSSSNC